MDAARTLKGLGRREGPLRSEGPGPAEAALALLLWILIDREATGVYLFRLAAATSQARYYVLLGALRLLEGSALLLYWRARGWSFDAWGLGGRRGGEGLRTGLLWSAVFALLVGAAEAVCRLGFGVSFLGKVTARQAEGGELLALLFVGGLIAPVFEEVLFRGILYGGFRKHFGVFLSATGASLLFASAHYGFRRVEPVQAVGAILFCVTYELSGSLWAPLIVHVTGNLALFLVPSLLRLWP